MSNGTKGKDTKKTVKPLPKKQTVAELRAEIERQNAIYKEVTLWVILAISIVLFISNFGVGGVVGGFFSNVVFGLFGLIAYVFPIFLFAVSAFIISNGKNKIVVMKVIAAILFVLFMCLFFELVSGNKAYHAIEAYKYSSFHHKGGGLFGGLLSQLIVPNFGIISAYVIDVIVLVISLVIVTERSAWKHVSKGGKKVIHSAAEGGQKMMEAHAKNKIERQKRRTERKAEGVALDTTVGSESLQRRDDLTELTPDSFDKTPIPEPVMHREVLKEPASNGKMQVNANVEAEAKAEVQALNEPVIEETPIFSPELQKLFAMDNAVATESKVVQVNSSEIVLEGNSVEPMQEVAQEQDNQEILLGVSNSAKQLNTLSGTTFVGNQSTLSSMSVTNQPEEPVKDQLEEQMDEIERGLSAEILPFVQSETTKTVEPVHNQISTPIADTITAPTPSVTEQVSSVPKKNPRQDAQSIQDGIDSIDAEIQASAQVKKEYVYPPVDLLKKANPNIQGDSKQHLQETAMKLQQTLKNFGVNVTISDVSCGPTVTRYEIQPEMGVKVSKIVNLTDDIKLNLAAADIRMEAPIPGKAAIGIEVPNKENVPVMFRELIESPEFKNHDSNIAFAAGKDIGGQVIMADIAKMPHLLIAGATGSGKSVCINTIIMSILYRANPEDVKLIMIDPKVVELSVYNGIPHLFIPVVTDPKKAAGALNWAVAEMTDRYQKFAECGVRDMKGYNQKVAELGTMEGLDVPKKMPQIVIIVDELADLMMVAPGDVEDAICRLAQLARAAGIHLIIATQRPSVNVITGLIKANMPSRIAFSVTSGIDSRTILDMVGAEKLLGKGDMLYYPQGFNKPLRVQGAFVSDKEVSDVVSFIIDNYGSASYNKDVEEKMNRIVVSGNHSDGSNMESGGNERDAYFVDAARLLMEKEKASIGMLQRYFKIGFNRAARIMDQLEEAGVVGPEEGTKPRSILMGPEQFEQYIEEYL